MSGSIDRRSLIIGAALSGVAGRAFAQADGAGAGAVVAADGAVA